MVNSEVPNYFCSSTACVLLMNLVSSGLKLQSANKEVMFYLAHYFGSKII